ncbi:hypothetical protein NP493_686g01016 [Ridgeia piscesae]|uniref:C-type lectin domain-containing protein n=1 Tax=Ridgeia piscesae TaxID=27915 RepID=A0AAD9NPP8_RIDPI|nr:hypothetical protein NP493_686g01016 [Ridgeia piscesae]
MSVKADRQLYTFLTPSDEAGRGERVGPGSVWRGFTDTTTSHGVPHVRRSVGVVKICFWCLITVVCVTALVYHLTMSSIQYFSYDTDVNVALITRRQLTFPAVTICNLNRVKQSAVPENSALSRLIGGDNRKRKKSASSSDCPNGLFKQDGFVYCYWIPSLDNDKTNFEGASGSCEAQAGRLAILDSQRKIDHINQTGLLKSASPSSLWVWLRKEDDPRRSRWVWGDGEEMTSRTLAEDYLMEFPMCTYMADDCTWISEKCSSRQNGMCEKRYGQNSTARCPPIPAYEEVAMFHDGTNNTCYYPVVPEGTYDELNIACVDYSSPMAVIDTDDQMLHLKRHTLCKNGLAVWISLTAVADKNELVWKWNGTRDLGNYDAWKTGYPKTPAGCVVISQVGDGQWQSVECSSQNVPLCERIVVDVTDPSKDTNDNLYPKRRPLMDDFLRTNRMMEILADLPPKSRQNIGYSDLELILDCEFAGSKCYMSDFATFYDTHHGNCYIFNSEWNQTQTPRVQELTGTRYGLTLTLNIGQDDYMKDIESSAGARIVVHPRGRMPFPKDEGVLAAPGQMSIIGIRQFNVFRLPEPYGNCTDTTERNIRRSVFEEVYPVRYSIAACYATCYQSYVIDRCGCADSQYPMEGAAFDYKRVSACNSNDVTEDTCRYHVRVDYTYNRLDCDCPLPCEEIGYTYQTSSSIWPADVHKDIVKRKLATKITRYFGNMTDDAKLWRNLLKVKVYYEDFNYEKIEESPSYSKVSFVSDVGGILGLWIGCSVLSLFEFLELSMDFFMLAVLRVFRRQRKGKTPSAKPTGKSLQPMRKVHVNARVFASVIFR